MKVLIACSMIEDELNYVIEKYNLADELHIIWVQRGYHDYPDKLNNVIAKEIAKAEDLGATEILLAYGLCGNGAIGWKSEKAILAMPRFDDCVNMMLCPATRTRRNLLETGKMYLTAGWIKEEGSLKNMIENARNRYGTKRGDKAIKMMLSAYHHLTILDTGCYELGPVREYAAECSDILGFRVEEMPGSITPMEKLLTGDWDQDIIVKNPHEPVVEADFAI